MAWTSTQSALTCPWNRLSGTWWSCSASAPRRLDFVSGARNWFSPLASGSQRFEMYCWRKENDMTWRFRGWEFMASDQILRGILSLCMAISKPNCNAMWIYTRRCFKRSTNSAESPWILMWHILHISGCCPSARPTSSRDWLTTKPCSRAWTNRSWSSSTNWFNRLRNGWKTTKRSSSAWEKFEELTRIWSTATTQRHNC